MGADARASKDTAMKLYLVRHAEAEDASETVTDYNRRLTAAGISRMRAAAQVMQRMGLKPRCIYSSPRARALQTAEIIGETLKAHVEVHDGVDFSFDVQTVEALGSDLNDNDELMFVGHDPSMSKVISDLTGANVVLKKGSLARIDIVKIASPLRGRLVWLIAPRVFDAVAKSGPRG